MRRFILVREEGSLIEEMSRTQLEAAVAAMDKPPCAIGVIWWRQLLHSRGVGRKNPYFLRCCAREGVLYDFVITARNWRFSDWSVSPWRPMGNIFRDTLSKRERQRRHDAALQSIITKTRRRFGL